VAPSGGGELGAGVGATPFGLLAEGSRYLCFAGGAVGEASGSGRGRVVVQGGGFFPFRVWWTGWAGLGCVVNGELRAGGQGEVLAARHVRSSLGRGSWGDEAGDEVPSDDYGRGLWRSGCGLENQLEYSFLEGLR
jgi:hypothetical protein